MVLQGFGRPANRTKRRHFRSFAAAVLAAAVFLTFGAFALEPEQIDGIISETYVVMDVATGQVLYARGAHQRLFPASITKILTCALALEKHPANQKIVMGHDAVFSIDRGSTHIALDEGEIISVQDLLNATMIESANDAANGLAQFVSGDLGAFAELMNKRAAEIGALDSHFVNANGLPDDDHYTTAYDMAVITRWL
jgi:D-alanyl-D-alanine carboxypeptidase